MAVPSAVTSDIGNVNIHQPQPINQEPNIAQPAPVKSEILFNGKTSVLISEIVKSLNLAWHFLLFLRLQNQPANESTAATGSTSGSLASSARNYDNENRHPREMQPAAEAERFTARSE